MSRTAVKSPIGQPFMELPEVDSTNIYAMEQLQAGKSAHGTVYFAHYQYAGKGQRGRAWHVEPGENITMTVVLDTSFLLITQQFLLSAAVAVACHRFYSKYALDETHIKWPNDIYWRDRKAAGILIENQVRGNNWQHSIAGMGINVNQAVFPEHLVRAVSLRQITGKSFSAVELAKELCAYLEETYQLLENGGGEEILAYYNAHLFRKGEQVKLKKENVVFSCTISGIDASGALLVTGSPYSSFRHGEVEWVF